MNPTASILIVDDEEDILDLLEYNLVREGYAVHRASNGEEALHKAMQIKPDLVLLDIMMPVMDGLETCRQLRAIKSLQNAYIVFLTARTEEISELAGFEAGADDYITKPIKPRVLTSRIKALLRRTNPDGSEQNQNTLYVHGLEIFRDSYTVKTATETLDLPRKEFNLLFHLASRPGKLFRREELLEKIWGDVHVVDRTVDVHIRKLREKLGDDIIQTVKGVGYKFVAE